jgi:hypothetical protein
VGWLALVLVGGCAVESDAARYTAVLKDRQSSTAHRIEGCAGIGDAALRGDCQVAVLQMVEEPLERWCPDVEPGRDQDECWFLAAERRKRMNDIPAAAADCLRAGAFLDDCGQHLWQSQLAAIAGRRGASFTELRPEAQRLYAYWDGILGAHTDISARFWTRFYEHGFGDEPLAVDLARCVDVPDAALCEAAGLGLYARRLAPTLARAGQDLCALDAPSSATLQPWMGSTPDPRLDAIITARVAAVCGG